MAEEYREEKYVKDVFIVGDDGKYYYVTAKEWRSHEIPADRVHQQLKEAVRAGAAVAALPEKKTDPSTSPEFDENGQPLGGDLIGLCYLLNIASLRVHE